MRVASKCTITIDGRTYDTASAEMQLAGVGPVSLAKGVISTLLHMAGHSGVLVGGLTPDGLALGWLPPPTCLVYRD